MKKQIGYLVILSLALAACSTTELAQEPRSSGGETFTPPPPIVHGANSQSRERPKADLKVESKPAPVVASALDKAQETLHDAIKSQNDEAIYRAAVQVLSLSPQDPIALNSLGLYHYKHGRVLAAEYFFSKALQSSPNSAEIHNNMGLAQLSQKENRDAIKSFRRAIELDPKNISAAANLGSLYVQRKDYGKAVIALEMVVKKSSGDYNTVTNYGVALAGVGNSKMARDQYERAIDLNSTGREAIYNLAVLEIEQLGKFKDGLDHLNKVKFLGVPDSARMKINALENKAKAGLK